MANAPFQLLPEQAGMLACPHCSCERLDLSSGDGDTIPSADHRIGDFDCISMAYVVHCQGCGERAWSLDFFATTQGDDALLDLIADGFAVEPNKASREGRDDPWHIAYLVNGESIGLTITTGWMKVPREHATHGHNGVSSCGSGDFWKHAGGVYRQIKPELSEALAYFERARCEEPQ